MSATTISNCQDLILTAIATAAAVSGSVLAGLKVVKVGFNSDPGLIADPALRSDGMVLVVARPESGQSNVDNTNYLLFVDIIGLLAVNPVALAKGLNVDPLRVVQALLVAVKDNPTSLGPARFRPSSASFERIDEQEGLELHVIKWAIPIML